MHIRVRARRWGELPLGAILSFPLFLLPLGAWLYESGTFEPGRCGAKVAFDLPCLSCGSTRATLNLLHGHPIEAVLYQPMMMGIYLALAIWGIVSMVTFLRNQRVVVELSDREDLLLKVAIVAVPVLNWCYLVAMGI